MTAIAHKLDPTRPTTEAILMWDVKKKVLRTNTEIAAPVVDNVDVLGINYGISNWKKLHETFPDKPFVGSETSTINTTRSAVVRDDSRCQIPLGYDIAKGENAWKIVDENEYCMGMFAWTGFDYFGEPTPYTYPAINSTFGIMDVCGFPKYPYYYYRANWRDDVDTFELCPHWNYVAGGEKRTVYLFSKCDEAELFVNGVSVGRRKIEKYFHAEWTVDFEPGEITAVGYKNGVETNRKTLCTTGAAAELRAEIEHLSVDANSFVWAIIKLFAVDSEGREVPTADNRVKFTLGEGVKLGGAGNGDPVCHENSKSGSRSLFGGLAQVIVRRDVSAGGGVVTFGSDGLNSVTLEF
jgi:beta-galactosidase